MPINYDFQDPGIGGQNALAGAGQASDMGGNSLMEWLMRLFGGGKKGATPRRKGYWAAPGLYIADPYEGHTDQEVAAIEEQKRRNLQEFPMRTVNVPMVSGDASDAELAAASLASGVGKYGRGGAQMYPIVPIGQQPPGMPVNALRQMANTRLPVDMTGSYGGYANPY